MMKSIIQTVAITASLCATGSFAALVSQIMIVNNHNLLQLSQVAVYDKDNNNVIMEDSAASHRGERAKRRHASSRACPASTLNLERDLSTFLISRCCKKFKLANFFYW